MDLINIDKFSSLYLYESFIDRNSKRTTIIYSSILIFTAALLISMPFIKISLSIKGLGIIRPISEKTEVKSTVTEIIDSVFIQEGQLVEKGAPILKLRTDNASSRQKYLKSRQIEVESCIKDLEWLTTKIGAKHVFKSMVYQEQFLYFSRLLDELYIKFEKSQKDYNRNKILFDSGVIPIKEFDDYVFQYHSAQNEVNISRNNQIFKWQYDLSEYKSTLKEIKSIIEQLNIEKELYIIRAPIAGNIEQFTGLYAGSTIGAGETVAIISPECNLIAEIYVSPKDIGYLSNTNKALIQVDAYNYLQWGILQGKIENISTDFILLDKSPMFRVRCSMDRSYLSLPSGVKGFLKKGMTVQGRFVIANRSLFQMIYQSANNWFNPNQSESVYQYK